MKVGVVGAKGRMGQAICRAVEADGAFELVARVDVGDEMRLLGERGAEVVVDVTNAAAARDNIRWYAIHGIDAVVGTTGFSDDDLKMFSSVYETEGARCLIVPNFSIGAVLMMRFAEQAAPYFDGVEIIELHHERKKDAPSGTARTTATRIAGARKTAWAPDPTEHETIANVRGGQPEPGIHMHSVRLPGLLAHQEVIFGSAGQTLTIRHDSYDTSSFMPGVLRALIGLKGLPAGLTVGLDAVLDAGQ